MQLKKNRKYTILVSGASGIVGYGILRSLRDTDSFLIGTTIYEMSPADCFADIVEHPPITTDETYIPWLLDIISKYKIDMIIPGIEADMSMWNQHRMELEATGTFVLLNNSELINLCLDKWNFYQCLCEHNFKGRIETTLEIDKARFGLPMLLKPRCGFGARGIVKINSFDELQNYTEQIGDNLVIQRYVGIDTEEYTVSAFFDMKCELKAYFPLKRRLSKTGFTEMATVVRLEEIEEILKELADFLKPVGPTNFQFRYDKDAWKLLEINPRISSSTSIRDGFGYNESQMCMDYFLKHKEITQPVTRKGSSVRYTEDYFFYDSTDI